MADLTDPSRVARHDVSSGDTHHGTPTQPLTLKRQTSPDQPRQARELLRVEDAAARLAIGRTTMFALIRDGAVESVKVGRLRCVRADAISRYIAHLASEQRAVG